MDRRLARESYLKTRLVTSTPIELMILFLGKAADETGQAINRMEEEKRIDKNKRFLEAQKAVDEVIFLLNTQSDYYIVHCALLDYTSQLLIEANIKTDIAPAEEALSYLTALLAEWKDAQQKKKQR